MDSPERRSAGEERTVEGLKRRGVKRGAEKCFGDFLLPVHLWKSAILYKLKEDTMGRPQCRGGV